MRNDILKFCYENNKNIYVVPKISDIIVRSASDISYFDSPIMRCTSNGLTIEQRAVKRFFDVLLSSFALLVLSPLFAVVALAIKVPSFINSAVVRVTLESLIFSNSEV